MSKYLKHLKCYMIIVTNGYVKNVYFMMKIVKMEICAFLKDIIQHIYV